jgi:hypothetical protein
MSCELSSIPRFSQYIARFAGGGGGQERQLRVVRISIRPRVSDMNKWNMTSFGTARSQEYQSELHAMENY